MKSDKFAWALDIHLSNVEETRNDDKDSILRDIIKTLEKRGYNVLDAIHHIQGPELMRSA
jgi:uncharacterized protein (UPF0297 family)